VAGGPPVSTTVPFAGSDADEIVFGPASTSVSFVSTVIAVAAASSSTVALSFTAVGGSSTPLTVMPLVSEPLRAVSSVTVNVIVRDSVDGFSELLL
jgi:hypothetical protein